MNAPVKPGMETAAMVEERFIAAVLKDDTGERRKVNRKPEGRRDG